MNDCSNIILDFVKQNQGCRIDDIIKATSENFNIEKTATIIGDLVDRQGLYYCRNTNKYYYANENLFIGYYFERKDQSFVEEWFKRLRKATEVINKPNGIQRGDFVLYQVQNNKANIIEIIKKNSRIISGTVIKDNNDYIFKSNSKPFRKIVYLLNSNSQDINKRITINIVEEFDNYINAEIVKRVGNEEDVDIDYKSVISEFNIKTTFSKKLLDNVEKISSEKIYKETKNKRKNLTNVEFITIDGDDAKDLDDAIFVEKNNDGNYKLVISIADVSSYVKENSLLDTEALERSTSVYLINSVVPMLPEKLSNDLCSLNPNTSKLTLSCEIIFDREGNIISQKAYPSIIETKKRFTYQEVNNYFNNRNNKIPFSNMLDQAYELYQLLYKKYIENGYIEFKISDVQIKLDNYNKPTDVYLKKQGESEKLIEFFMLSANSAIAKICNDKSIPILYRIHNNPNPDLYKSAINGLKTLSKHFKIIDDIKEVDGKYIQYILDKFNGGQYQYIANKLLLKSMDKAKYDFRNNGHFAIGTKNYCHFTSPIRRYPDLIVHRMLWKYLFNNEKIDPEKEIPKLIRYSTTNNDREIDAQMCERKYYSIKKARYLLNKKHEKFEATVSTVIRNGIFLELPNTISGMINIFDLKSDFFVFDNQKSVLVGKNTGKRYSIGQHYWVKVKNIYPKSGQIDFIFYKNNYKSNYKKRWWR